MPVDDRSGPGTDPESSHWLCPFFIEAFLLCYHDSFNISLYLHHICILYLPDTSSPWFLHTNWPAQTHQHHRRPKANPFFYFRAVPTFVLSLSRLCLLASLAAVFSSPSSGSSLIFSLFLSHSCCHTSSLKTDLVMYQSQQKGYAENTWMGGGTTGLRCRQHKPCNI